jgi:hypothetical protein
MSNERNQDRGRIFPLTTDAPQAYPAEKARQGEIVLKTRQSRTIFLTGLFGGLVIVALLAIYLVIVS